MKGLVGRGWAAALRAAVLALALTAGACSDVSGPGTVRVELSGDESLGAVALKITGLGIGDVTAAGPGWMAAHPFRDGDARGVRVVLVREEPGSVSLAVSVRDVSAVLPEVVVLEASDRRDRVIYDLSRIRVRVVR